QALGARHHDEGRPRDDPADDAHSLPRILTEIAHADIEDRAPHEIDRLEAEPIEDGRHRQHHGGGHARRPQGLMCVAQSDVDQANALHRVSSSSTQRVWMRPATKSGWPRIPRWNGRVVAMPSTSTRSSACAIRWMAALRSRPWAITLARRES